MKIHSDDISEVAKALLAVQTELKSVVRNQSTKAFSKYSADHSYADLTAVINSIRVILTKNNLAITQIPNVINGEQVLLTILMHISGQYISSTYKIDAYVNKQIELMQERNKTKESYVKDINVAWLVGGSISYAKRYTLCAMLGIVDKEENDAGVIIEHDEYQDRNLEQKKYLTENSDTKTRFDPNRELISLCKASDIDVKAFAHKYNITSTDAKKVQWGVENFEQLKTQFNTRELAA